jgi:hypothetical protein
MTLSTFPVFLTFLTQALCFPAPASNAWQGLEIAPCLRRGPRTAGPGGDDLSRRSESESAATSLRHAWTRNSDRSTLASLARAVPFLAERT